MAVWIGLTGGIGSGKSVVAQTFASLGVPVIDADALSRALTAPNGQALPAIRQEFGEHLFDEHGCLKRDVLRDEVFRRPEQKKKLEALMFPLILSAIAQEQITHHQAVYGVIDVPLLVENLPFLEKVSRVLVIDVEEAEQIKRVHQRSGLAEDEIKRIMATQASRETRLLYADDVITNHDTIEQLQKKIHNLHRYYHARYAPKIAVNPTNE